MAIAEHDISLDTFDSLNPATGEVVASFPIHGEDDVRAAVTRARTAADWWAGLGYSERKHRLLAWKGVIARRADELVDLIHAENGKPRPDAILTEIVMTIDHLNWAARHAPRVLRRRYYPPTGLTANQLSSKVYEPLGVVGVIGPWNYPVFTPMGSISYALAAGNAVIFKPSEYTPAIAKWLVDAFADVVAEQPVLQLITGHGETGAALCRAGVSKIAFTGSGKTGRKVMAACAETLTPVVIEGGGKDAFIVAADADIELAARTAAFGAFSNSGQTCAGVETVYVEQPVYDEFVDRLAAVAREVRAGSDDDATYGPITMPSQLDVIRRQVDDALDRGARPVVGSAESIRPPFVDPIVLVDVPEDSLILKEETFGPILPIAPVASLDEAVRRANDTHYGLGAAVFSRKHGPATAGQLHCGMVAINDFAIMAAHPALPWGGVEESGFGRIHGEDGMKEFVRAKAMTRKLYSLPASMALSQFPRNEATAKGVENLYKLTRFLHGRS